MKKILLVDDDEDDQFFFKEVLTFINPALSCDIAADGKIALAKLKVSASLPDIIFLDLNMPIMNGFDFLTQIKKEDGLSNIPVGIFSTSNMLRDKELTKELGAQFFLTKPNDFQLLLKKLQQILASNFSNNEFIILA